jgi:hypothetical protein
MPKFRLGALAAATIMLACLPSAPAAAAGPLLAPLIVGHVIGAAARVAASSIAAASMLGQPAAPAAVPYVAPGYYAAPASPYYRPSVVYQAWPSRYYAPSVYRAPARYVASAPRYPQGYRGYYAPSMRYSGLHGTPVYGTRGYSYRRR